MGLRPGYPRAAHAPDPADIRTTLVAPHPSTGRRYRQVISTPDAPQDPRYSQAVKVGNTIYVAGTVGFDVATGEFAGSTIREQTRQSLLNCQAILRAAGAELSDVVMVHTLLLRPEDADGVVDVFDEFFPDVRPPRCVSRIGRESDPGQPEILVSNAMVAVTAAVPVHRVAAVGR